MMMMMMMMMAELFYNKCNKYFQNKCLKDPLNVDGLLVLLLVSIGGGYGGGGWGGRRTGEWHGGGDETPDNSQKHVPQSDAEHCQRPGSVEGLAPIDPMRRRLVCG